MLAAAGLQAVGGCWRVPGFDWPPDRLGLDQARTLLGEVCSLIADWLRLHWRTGLAGHDPRLHPSVRLPRICVHACIPQPRLRTCIEPTRLHDLRACSMPGPPDCHVPGRVQNCSGVTVECRLRGNKEAKRIPSGYGEPVTPPPGARGPNNVRLGPHRKRGQVHAWDPDQMGQLGQSLLCIGCSEGSRRVRLGWMQTRADLSGGPGQVWRQQAGRRGRGGQAATAMARQQAARRKSKRRQKADPPARPRPPFGLHPCGLSLWPLRLAAWP